MENLLGKEKESQTERIRNHFAMEMNGKYFFPELRSGKDLEIHQALRSLADAPKHEQTKIKNEGLEVRVVRWGNFW